MTLEVSIARTKKSSSCGDDPRSSLNDVRNHKIFSTGIMAVVGQENGERGGDEDRDNVGTAKHSMKLWIATAYSAGELQWTAEQCNDSPSDVRNNQKWDGT